MASILSNSILLIGCAFVFIAALGVLRLPDFYTRTHAATKAGSFGGGLIALAAGIYFGEAVTWIQIFGIIAFFYFTTPVAGHLMGRVALLRGTYRYQKKETPGEK